MSTLQYPSKLQQRYAQTVFPVPNEQIISILAKVDDKTFDKLCEEPEFQAYCSSNSILAQRLYEERSYRTQSEAKFDFDICEFKPKEMKWKEFYNRIKNFISNYKNGNYIYNCVQKVKLMELKILYSIDKNRFNVYFANYAAKNDHLEVLKWLASLQPPILPTQIGADYAAEYGHLEVLKWLASLEPPILPSERGANFTAEKGHLEVLKWLATLQPPILPNRLGADYAAEYGHLEVLKWLTSLEPPILPSVWGANSAAHNGHLEVLKWLSTLQPPILPSQDGTNWAAVNGHLEVLKWLVTLQSSILPTQFALSEAAKNNHIEVVRWLASKGIYPN